MSTLEELLAVPRFSSLKVLNKHGRLDHKVESVEITETPDVSYYIPKNVLILTTAMSFKDDQEGLISFIDSLIEGEVAGLAIKVNRFLGMVDDAVLAYADQKGFPIISIPSTFPLGTLLHHMMNFLWDKKQEEIFYALDIQKTFSNLIINDANIGLFVMELEKMFHTPVLLLNPFHEEIASSKYFQSSRFPAPYYINQIIQSRRGNILEVDSFLIKDVDDKELQVAIYPIHSYQYIPYYMVVFRPENIPYPISSFALEQAVLVLSYTLYKNLKISESQLTIQSDILLNLLLDQQTVQQNRSNLLEISNKFGIIDSKHYQMIYIDISVKNQAKQKIKYKMEINEIVTNWLKERLEEQIPNAILARIKQNEETLLILQSEIPNIEEQLQSLAERVEQFIPVFLTFSFGHSSETLHHLRDSYTQAKLAYKNSLSMLEKERFNYYRPRGILQLFNNLDKNEVSYFVTSTLKELAFPDDSSLIELRKTLKTYLDNQCEITKTAHELYIHRNTVKYRIERCEEIVGLKLTGSDVSLNIRLALELSENNE
ncbi:PucR family transcriptional regulator [Jeotgalibaca caeni]|uniref:PucR family transcriptional regulator n=1 Tax=Jeotgalibaca caeni TaxID=3028623 RepID=UPI00237E2F30|nr:PucR family transcriptional regulator [Jeotgalibaca caeni]MDE1547659.1 PucR family transcriptional regulator [Jeotgalibaca caeni]